ncbi:uncharacterized protein LOC141634526 [Silene latifolia]|uniref:uncharacterized protein LOC141634526 n=1 Tax=Silene latifolia TaxID=37657 RepID=UPI003D77FCA9
MVSATNPDPLLIFRYTLLRFNLFLLCAFSRHLNMTNDANPKSTFHPAYSVSNIKNFVPIVLEAENVHYASWAELFLNTARAYDVLDHVAPPKDVALQKDSQWDRLDAIVKQWIYSTISLDLLHTILEPGLSAQDAWDRLKDIFNENKNSRAVFLEQQFTSTHMDNFPNVSAYCQKLKMIADQLTNVGSPVPETRLVLQLVTHLSAGYNSVATLIQQSDPLSSFYKARSMLTLEESRIAKESPDTALLTSQNPSADTNTKGNNNKNGNSNNNYKGKGNRHNNRGNYRGKNHGGGSNFHGGGNNNNNGGSSNSYYNKNNYRGQQSSVSGLQQPWTWVPLSPWSQQPPPCPYPTSGWSAPNANPSAGILGPRPQQAFIAQPYFSSQAPGAFVPTDIAAAMQSLNFQSTDDGYYMDTGASSQMQSSNGTLSSYSSLSDNRHIVVGNGTLIPIIGLGHAHRPSPHHNLILKNVLHVPSLIKNLVSVRKFTMDNNVSVSFDPFGFTVKDLKTGKQIMRSNSTGDLCPLIPTRPSATANPTALLAASSSTWHDRLGHPGHTIFNSANGDLERYKARLFVNGRSQQIGVDCDETFSPVVKPTTIRVVLSLAVSKKWSIHQLDVKNAFLHGHLAETVYMHQPPGFRDKDRPNHVCLLKKSLYGLKQAPRAWYHRFASFMSKIGFTHSRSDNSLFIFKNGNDISYLLLYVDDIILATSSDKLRLTLMRLLHSEFAMTDLGPLNFFLGVPAIRHKHGLFLHQQRYDDDIVNRANMGTCKPANTPVDTNSKLSATAGAPVADPSLFHSLAGALQYLTFTRPDIAYAVQQGGCPETRRSTSGYCVYLGVNLVTWSSKRQATVSRSSAEAEYRGVANVVAKSCWVRNLLLELHWPIRKATFVYCDNVSAIYLSGNLINHQRIKHIELDIHFVREKSFETLPQETEMVTSSHYLGRVRRGCYRGEEDASNSKDVTPSMPSYEPLPPFPEAFKDTKKKEHDTDIYKTFRKCEVNIPLLEMLKSVPSFFFVAIATNHNSMGSQKPPLLSKAYEVLQNSPPIVKRCILLWENLKDVEAGKMKGKTWFDNLILR